MKKIAFIGVYSKPELISSSHLTTDIIFECKKVGHDTLYISPNQVRGLNKNEIKKFKKTRVETDEYGKHVVIKSPSFRERNFVFRLFRYKVFAHRAIKYLRKNFHPDYIFLWSYPPLGLSKSIVKYAKKQNIKVIYDVHDIQPDILSINSLIKAVIRKHNSFVLKNANYIFTLSEDMKETLLNKKVTNCNIGVIPPWDYIFEVRPIDNKISSCFKKESDFIVGYVGNIGNFQNIELLLKIASNMAEYKHIKFLFVGSGALTNLVMEYAEKYENILFFRKISENEAANLYSFCDLNVISLKKGLISYCCPSKTPMILKSSSNILIIVDESKFADELRSNGSVYVGNFDEDEIVQSILNVSKQHEIRKVKKTSYDRDNCLARWNAFFEGLKNE